MDTCHEGLREFVRATTLVAVERDDVTDIAKYVAEETMQYASENNLDIDLDLLMDIAAKELVTTLLEMP